MSIGSGTQEEVRDAIYEMKLAGYNVESGTWNVEVLDQSEGSIKSETQDVKHKEREEIESSFVKSRRKEERQLDRSLNRRERDRGDEYRDNERDRASEYRDRASEYRDRASEYIDRRGNGTEELFVIVSPVDNLIPLYSQREGEIELSIKREYGKVILQWEPFNGMVAANGKAFIAINQKMVSLPKYTMYYPIYLTYKGENRAGIMTVEPSTNTGNIKFYFNSDMSSTGIIASDEFTIYGSNVMWLRD